MQGVPHKNNKISLSQVKKFWEEHPLLSYELSSKPGSITFFKEYDEIRDRQEFKYCFHLLGLAPGLKEKMVLDVGCGNGWLLSKYTAYGLRTIGIDLTMRAIKISMARFKETSLPGQFVNASAQDIPFKDDSFDLVTSLGVIHHTPETVRSAQELIRVCRPGGRVLIAVYYENLLLKKFFYLLTRMALKFLGRPDMSNISRQEFVNRFDGIDNPMGKVFTKREAMGLLKGLKDLRYEIHYFPARFIPRLKWLNAQGFLEFFLDHFFGFLIYVEAYKPNR